MRGEDLDLVDALVKKEVCRLRDSEFPGINEVFIRTEWENSEEPELYGLFSGIPENEFCIADSGILPNEIVIYAKSLVSDFGREEELAKEVRITLLHEIGHAFGFSERELVERGLG